MYGQFTRSRASRCQPGTEFIPAVGLPALSVRRGAARDACLIVQFFDADQLLVELVQSQREKHLANRDMRVIGPEDAPIFVLVVTESNLVAVFSWRAVPFFSLILQGTMA